MSAPVNQSAVAYPRPVESVALTVAMQTLYTAPAYTTNVASPAATAMVKELIIANTTAGSLGVSIYKVPASGSWGTGNALMYGVPVAANDAKFISGTEIFLAPGDSIQATSPSTGITVTLSVVEYQ